MARLARLRGIAARHVRAGALALLAFSGIQLGAHFNGDAARASVAPGIALGDDAVSRADTSAASHDGAHAAGDRPTPRAHAVLATFAAAEIVRDPLVTADIGATASIAATDIAAPEIAAKDIGAASTGGSTGVEPYGLGAAAVRPGPLLDKWLQLAAALKADMAELAACRANPSGCGSKAAQRLLAIANAAAAKPGRARLGEVNRAVNLAIRPMSDMAQHGVIDFWNSPLATLTSGRGDCEDYAIVKYAALRLAGLAEHDLRLLIVRDKTSGGDHAVLAVRLEGRWLLLDNRGLMMIEDRHAPQYRALYAVTATAIAQLVPAAIAGSQLAALAARRAPAM